MMEGVQTNEQAITAVKEQIEDVLDRLSNYPFMAMSEECADEGLLFAVKFQRMLDDAHIRASKIRLGLEKSR